MFHLTTDTSLPLPPLSPALKSLRLALVAIFGWQVAELNSQSFSPALNLNLRWLYLSSVVGGVLIVLYSAASIADGWRGRWPSLPGPEGP